MLYVLLYTCPTTGLQTGTHPTLEDAVEAAYYAVDRGFTVHALHALPDCPTRYPDDSPDELED